MYKAEMCFLISVNLSRRSQKQGFKNANKPNYAGGSDEKEFYYNIYENTLGNKVMI